MKSKAPGRPVSLVHDRVLSQRLEACLEVPSLRDFDDIVEYMRNAFPEYKRQKLGPFKMQLSRCNDALAVRRPELFQVRESFERMLSNMSVLWPLYKIYPAM